MPMLAGQVDARHRGRHPPRHPRRRRLDPDRRAAGPSAVLGRRRRLSRGCSRFAAEQAPGRRVWAIEGTGGYGAGLASFLLDHGEWVVEIDRPSPPSSPQRRQERRPGRDPGRPRGAGPRAPGQPAPARPPGGAAGAAGHPQRRSWPRARRPASSGADCHRPEPLRGALRGAGTEQARACAALRGRPPRIRWSTAPPCGRCGRPPGGSWPLAVEANQLEPSCAS